MNLQMFEPAIALHVYGTRQRCAYRSTGVVIGSLTVCLFATTEFASKGTCEQQHHDEDLRLMQACSTQRSAYEPEGTHRHRV